MPTELQAVPQTFMHPSTGEVNLDHEDFLLAQRNDDAPLTIEKEFDYALDLQD